MSKTKTNSAALVILSDPQISTAGGNLKSLQEAAITQLQQIRSLEREAGLRAILCGLALHRVKASLKHGEFGGWIRDSLKGAGKSQANNYMRLAAVAVEKAKVTKPDLLALPGDQTEFTLDHPDEAARQFMAKLAKFVGEKSLNELLRDYGIKGAPQIGGKRDAGASSEDDSPPAALDPEELYQQARDEIGGLIERGELLLLTENRLQYLAGHPDEIKGVVSGLRTLADKVEAAARPFLKPAKA